MSVPDLPLKVDLRRVHLTDELGFAGQDAGVSGVWGAIELAKTLHEEAMGLAELADVAKLRGAMEEYRRLLAQAVEKAVVAADEISSNIDAEPTRSIVHRSAAVAVAPEGVDAGISSEL